MARNRNPWFPQYYRDWLESERVTAMELDEEGLYRRCCDFQAIHGTIPADIRMLANRLQKSLRTVKRAWPVVSQHFQTDPEHPGRLFNERMREILNEKNLKSQKCAVGAAITNSKKTPSGTPSVPHSARSKSKNADAQRTLRASTSTSVSVSTSSSVETSKTKTRARRPLFDALVEVTCVDPAIGSQGSYLAKVEAELERIGYSADEVRTFGELYAHPASGQQRAERSTR
jgi:hypothetical protein